MEKEKTQREKNEKVNHIPLTKNRDPNPEAINSNNKKTETQEINSDTQIVNRIDQN